MNKQRLEAFSDGVMAIIITIMVLELKVPNGGTLQDLILLIPVLLSYIQSFLFVGVYWNNHHHLLHTVQKMNGRIMLSNMALLFSLSLVPFVTAWVGASHFAPTAVALYAVILLLCAFSWTILQIVIERSATWTDRLQKAMKYQERKGYLSVILYAAGIPFAFVNPIISEVLYVTVAIIWLVPSRRVESAFED